MVLTLGLFLIGSLHTMIFAIFQIPKNFLMGHSSPYFGFFCKLTLYLFAILTSFVHQRACRNFGLRRVLYFGLLCNFFGLATMLVNQEISSSGIVFLIFVDMMLFGMALTSVVNALVTYITIEFPKNVGMAIVALFAFFNVGPMIAPLLMDAFHSFEMSWAFFLGLMLLLGLSLWFVHVYFFDPPIPSDRIHLKKESLLWKELHYRLALFVLGVIAYGFTETSFDLWGYVKIGKLFGSQIADETISFFWLFLILGQVFLLIPLYFISPKKIFYFLVTLVIGSALLFPGQENLSGIIPFLAIAGFGCSAVFPILLSQMEKELMPLAQGASLTPYIEKSISLMIAGYFIGVGAVDLWVELLRKTPLFSMEAHFTMAAGAIGLTTLISIFLDLKSVK
jgi:MFS family permease